MNTLLTIVWKASLPIRYFFHSYVRCFFFGVFLGAGLMLWVVAPLVFRVCR